MGEVFSTPRSSLRYVHSGLQHRLKARRVLEECERHLSGRAVALLGYDQLGFALQFGVVLLVNLFAEDEGDHIGVLLDGARFAEVGELRTVIAAAALGGAAELRKRND